ncbi:uncharacterized protein A1O5_02563 [Cladophialophora psammophila CBS 110553]|uniref:Cytochrome P450 oxidoreductase n=1 Tax=Cladophialophora psammophila CBS 110553 TaxID=1182543 RepID=W9X1C0_9EURO|nr:uncharacterized protein A1O5_02563 [Cladophialophora psammophila CBS 110553]EXJ74267.1 hypothetical protein A1O5_02563 [Cladophialophora psammophila CBS 110553]
MTSFLLLGSALLAASFLLYVCLFVGKRGRNFPDGPPTLPVIGNLHQLPKQKLYLQFTEWAKKYGGLYTIKLGPGTVAVLTDRRIIKQLLEKKSATSSNRPPNEVGRIIGEGDHVLLMNNTPTWRVMRKVIHQDFTEALCDKEHTKIQQSEMVQLLHDMLETPEDWGNHLKRTTNSIVMSVVYGIRSPSSKAAHMERLEALLQKWARIQEFGATPPVDIFPFLKAIPERFLGNWVTRATVVHDEMHTLYTGLLNSVLKRRQAIGSQHTVLDRLLDQQEKTGLTTHQITLLAGVTIKGGSDTSASVLTSFVQAMVVYPEVQKRAKAEIDSVLGEDRVPEWSDYNKLPYVAQIVKESHRWRPVAPLSVPHALSEDEWIDGKFLPKGTICFVNVWGLHHDDAKFPNHEVFDPDHYKGRTLLAAEYANSPDYENRDHYGYGHGRRLCPGIHLAERNLFHAISKILWAFDIEKATDPATGKPIQPDTDVVTGYREGLTACAYDFPVKLTVRSQARRQAIEREYREACANFFPQYEKVGLETCLE